MSEMGVDISSTAETKNDSVGSMIMNVFFEPMRVFRRIKEKPTWVIPFVIFLVISAAGAYLVAPLGFEAQKQQIMASDKYTPEQKEEALRQMETFGGLAPLFGVLAAIFGGAVVIFIATAIIMFMGNVVFGGTAKYIALLSLVCFSEMIGVLGQIVKTPLMLWKQSIDVRTSLAVLLPGSDMSSAAYILLNSVTDVFMVWQIILVIFGVAAIYNFTRGKAAMVVLIPLVVVAAVVGLLKLAI